MRYFSLFSVLSLLSLDLYGAEHRWQQLFHVMDLPNIEENQELKVLHGLSENRDRWLKSAKKAALHHKEPKHLLEILKIEKILFAKLLQQKESTIENDPVKWKKHAFAALVSFQRVRWTATQAAWAAAKAVDEGVTKDHLSWRTVSTAPWNTANCLAWRIGISLPKNSGIYCDVNSLLNSNTIDAARDSAIDTTRAAINTARCITKKLIKKRRVAFTYRIAETQVWITVLDPSLNLFEKAYDAAYSELASVSEENLGEWFSSKENFMSKLNKYFVNSGELENNDRAKEFLKHLQAHLNRIVPQMFPEYE